MSTQIRGQQIRLATLQRGHIDAAFEASLAAIESNITSIFNTMSTDQERLDAIAAVTLAWQNADGNLQSAITSLINATKAGAGLEADGSYVVGESNYLDGSTSLKKAIAALDAALKTSSDAAAAALADEVAARVAADAAEVVARNAAIAAAVAATSTTSTALQDSIDAEAAARLAADTQFALDLANEATARTNSDTVLQQAIANEASARATADSDEAAARALADTTLQSAITAESLARTEADAVHTAAISQEVTDRGIAVAAEAAARLAADEALDARVDVIEAAAVSALSYDKLVVRETPVGAIDGVNAVFTLANAPYAGTETVFLNGMLLEPGAENDYQLVGQEITLVAPPLAGDRVKVSYFR